MYFATCLTSTDELINGLSVERDGTAIISPFMIEIHSDSNSFTVQYMTPFHL